MYSDLQQCGISRIGSHHSYLIWISSDMISRVGAVDQCYQSPVSAKMKAPARWQFIYRSDDDTLRLKLYQNQFLGFKWRKLLLHKKLKKKVQYTFIVRLARISIEWFISKHPSLSWDRYGSWEISPGLTAVEADLDVTVSKPPSLPTTMSTVRQQSVSNKTSSEWDEGCVRL